MVKSTYIRYCLFRERWMAANQPQVSQIGPSKDYSQFIDFPVEIIGRDGIVNTYLNNPFGCTTNTQCAAKILMSPCGLSLKLSTVPNQLLNFAVPSLHGMLGSFSVFAQCGKIKSSYSWRSGCVFASLVWRWRRTANF